MDSKLIKELNQNIIILNQRIKRQNSLWRNLMLSIFRGVGYFIGATIIASIAIYFISQTIKSISDVPILKDFLDPEKIEQIEINTP